MKTPCMATFYSTVLFLTSVISTVYAPGVDDDGTYFQFINVPGKYEYNFGFNRGNSEHSVSRYEEAKGSKVRSMVQWSDKHGGSGEQYWEYNHVDKGKKRGHGKGSIASYPPVSYGSSLGSKGSLGNIYGSLGSDFGGVHSGFGDTSLGSFGGNDYGFLGSGIKSGFGGLEGGINIGFGDSSLGNLGGSDYGSLGAGFGSLEGGAKGGFSGSSLGSLGGRDYGTIGVGFGGPDGAIKSGFGDNSLGSNGFTGLKSGFSSTDTGSSFGSLGSDFNTGSASNYGDLGNAASGGGFYPDFGSTYGSTDNLGSGLQSSYGSLGSGGAGGGFPGFGSDFGDSFGGTDGSYDFSEGDFKTGLGNGGAYGHLPGIEGLGDSFGNAANTGVRYKGNYDSIPSGSSTNKVKSNAVYYDRPGGKPIKTSVVKAKGNVGGRRRPPGGRHGVSRGRGKHGGSNKYGSSQRVKGVAADGSRPLKPISDNSKRGPYEGVVYDSLVSASLRANNTTTQPPCNNRTHVVTNYGTFLSGYGKNSSTRNARFRTAYQAPEHRHLPYALDHKVKDQLEEINQGEEDYVEELNVDDEEYDTSNTNEGGNKEMENDDEADEENEQSKDEEDPR